MFYLDAIARANRMINVLLDGQSVHRVNTAGALRMEAAEIDNLAFVAIPVLYPVISLFGETTGHADGLVDFMRSNSMFSFRVDGDMISGSYDLYGDIGDFSILRSDKDRWGVDLFRMTGPQSFVEWFFTPRDRGGAAPRGYAFSDGRLSKWGDLVTVEDERSLFSIFGVRYLSPKMRRQYKPSSYKTLLYPIRGNV